MCRHSLSKAQDAYSVGARGRAAYRIPYGAWFVEPALDVDLAYVRLSSYAEDGADASDLDVDAADATILTGTPWIRAGRRAALADNAWLEAYVAAGASFSTGEDPDVRANFAGIEDDGFTTTLANPDTAARLAMGVELLHGEQISLRIQ